MRVKWYLWHGNVEKALGHLEDAYILLMDDELSDYFERWYPGVKIKGDLDKQRLAFKKAA